MPRPVVLVLHPHLAPLLPALEGGFEARPGWGETPAEVEARAEAVVVAGEFPLDKARLERMGRLKLIACFSSGYDGIDVAWARGRGLEVTHALAVNHEDVADYALGLIIAARREIVAGDRLVREGGWSADAKPVCRSLGGARLGIVGFGRIGEALARRAQACRMELAWWGPRAKPDVAHRQHDSLVALARWSDILAVTAKAHDANRGLVSAEVIAALGPGGLLVNVARGQLVDEDALIDALRSGALGAAALDVFAEEPTPPARWAGVPNLILTPHRAGATDQAVARMLELLLANLAAVLGGGAAVTPAA